MTTMAMAPVLPKTATRATVRATSSSPRPSAERGLASLHLTARGRVVLWFVAVVMIAAAVLVTSRAAADGPVSAQQVERHVVQPGETMWQIASVIAEPGEDVRDVVFDLVRLNELPDAGLMAGQVIVVPVD